MKSDAMTISAKRIKNGIVDEERDSNKKHVARRLLKTRLEGGSLQNPPTTST
jgi:hypothetical protein